MEFWRLVKKPKQTKSLVIKLLRDVDSGFFSAPKAYDSLTRYRTEELAYTGPQPFRLNPPEQPLLRTFFQKYPEARSEPMALNSFAPPLARQFVEKQQQLMLAGADQMAAFAEAEVAFQQQLAALRRRHLASLGGGTNPLDLVQQQEQEALDAGLEALETQRAEAAGARTAAGGR